jgi:hypothetical protein
MATPILDLATLTRERPPIRVDGVTYYLKSPDELTLMESHQFGAWGKALEALGKEPERVVELEELVGVVARAALSSDMPHDVFARLAPTQKLAIVEVFTGLLLSRRLRLAGAIAAAAKPTGASSSPASSTSMAAILAGGFTRRRPRSSGLT